MKSENESPNDQRNSAESRDQMVSDIGSKQARKIHARHTKDQGIWFGLGMMGTVGWSIVIPTLFGVALGIWVDAHYPSYISWTLMLLLVGLLLGCLNAWLWVSRQQRNMERNKKDRESE
jgi:ATP synthase protein I